MTSSISQWKPSADIKTHKGNSIPPNLVFFTPPPREIVNLRSAASTLETGKPGLQMKGIDVFNKIFSAVFLSWAGGMLVFVVVILLDGFLDLQLMDYALIAVSIVAVIILFLSLRGEWKLPTYCNYVGDNGIANYAYGKEANSKNGIGLFLFHQAEELRVNKIQQYVNRAYQYTTYIFEWRNTNNEIVFHVGGLHRSREDNPPPLDRYYFALAAEKAWSLFKFEQVKQELEQNGKLKFRLQKDDAITVTKDYIELFQKGNSIRFNSEEISKIDISRGVIQIIPKEVRPSFLGFNHDGILRIPYKDMANARIFILVFDMLINQK
ncbi:hypothetical protein NIES267_02330 [Calothrix parasitica NIES-267]|uniref:Uncharacterized protein n=1 Tax=Calothrix parasitica NIES-267 TaxID=1973488 RepID=A0A1Z4LI51_9CYAN|nr:hypothetical protein NIES267_02330 [Calothrix parasitica NIES-267]